MIDGQFQLGPVTFGAETDPVVVLTGGFDKGTYQVRDQDVDDPVGDRVLFGRDRLTPGEWSFELLARDDIDAGPVLAGLAAAWRADTIRATPGAVVPLRYREDGTEYVVYGRPRKFTPVPEKVHDRTARVAAATFRLADTCRYAADPESVTLGLVSTTPGGGVVLPAVLKWTLAPTTAATRKGVAYIGGTLPTPVRVVITGPVSGTAANVTISTPSWRLAIPGGIATGRQIILDTRTGVMTLDGAPWVGVTRDSSLYLRIPPGTTEFTLTADDPTASVAAVVSWQAADPLI